MGVKNLPADSAERLAGSDADYNNRKLYNTIANGKYVSIESHVCSPRVLSLAICIYHNQYAYQCVYRH